MDAVNNAVSQRHRIAQWFARNASLTTEQARRELDVMSPAARVFELRADGWLILTVWDWSATACGRLHRMARYVLLGRP